MRRAIGLLAIPLIITTVYAEAPKQQPQKAPAPPPQGKDVKDVKDAKDASALSDKATLLSPIQIESLTLTPIVAVPVKDAPKDENLLVLDEAMAAKQVKIKEVAEGSVNSLTLI